MTKEFTVTDLVKAAHDNAVAKGFYDGTDINVGEKLMLIVSEVSEALEAHRKGRITGQCYVWEHKDIVDNDQFKTEFEKYTKDSMSDELADVAIRLFDLAGALKIDLESHIIAKMRYNAMRPHKHGKAY